MRVAAALAPQPGSRVLDLCAAPGGKTTHLAELMRNEGEIVACDVDERRLQTRDDAVSAGWGSRIVETRAGCTRSATRSRRPGRSTPPWWTCRAATPACWAAGPRPAGG